MNGSIDRLLRLGLALAFNPARLMEDAASAARRMALLLACTAFAGFVLLPAIGCAAAGVWIFVQHRLGPVWAAFITAAALALVAVIVLLIGLAASRGRGRSERPRRENRAAGPESGPAPAAAALDMAAAALPALLGLLSVPRKAAAAGAAAGRGVFARHKGTFLLAAAVAGLVVGQDLIRPRRRERKTPRGK